MSVWVFKYKYSVVVQIHKLMSVWFFKYKYSVVVQIHKLMSVRVFQVQKQCGCSNTQTNVSEGFSSTKTVWLFKYIN